MSLVEVLVGILAVWRITHLLVQEDGPWGLGARLREAAGDGFWGEWMDCFLCVSAWVALPAALLVGAGPAEWLLLWPGLSGGAILLERGTTRTPPAHDDGDASALWEEDP